MLFGFYTGARLSDVATLTWQNIDRAASELRFMMRKTGRPVVLPLAVPLREHIERLPAGDDPSQPLHPRAFEVVSRGLSATAGRWSGRSGGCSSSRPSGRSFE